MNIVRVFLTYNLSFRAHPRYYSEKSDMSPMANIALDMAVQKVSRGRKGFVGVRNYIHNCPECGVKFWSDRKEERCCGRWKCFRVAWGRL